MTEKIIAYQGYAGAYSQMACLSVFPSIETLSCPTFEQTIEAVHEGKADLAMLPIENSIAGRVADIHSLLPDSKLFIIGEHYQKVEHCLLGCQEASLKDIKSVHSHFQALSQCRKFINEKNFQKMPEANTAIAAKNIAEANDVTRAAIASKLSAKIYGLKILESNIEDATHNTTRFLIMSKSCCIPEKSTNPVVTSFIFKVKNIPAALYKSLGGFATNGINITKLESYLADGDFIAAQFYADVEAHPEDKSFKLAIEELAFFSHEIKLLGTYPAHPFRFANRRP